MPYYFKKGEIYMCNEIYITSVTTTETAVILIPNRTVTFANLANTCKYDLIIACGLKASASLPVFIQTSSGNIPLLDKFANTVYPNQLRTRFKYCIGYGNGNTAYTLGQFVIFNNLCCASGSSGVATTASIEEVAEMRSVKKNA